MIVSILINATFTIILSQLYEKNFRYQHNIRENIFLYADLE